MQLTKDIELIDGLPIIYIKSLHSLVISDSHFGYEGVIAKSGIYVPKANLKNILKMLLLAIKKRSVSTIIVNGDIKNEFSSVDSEELNELIEFVKFIKQKDLKLILIKGNHDNFVDKYKQMLNLEIFDQEMSNNQYLFFHGEAMPKNINKNIQRLIMGHEHPSISIITKIGRKEKLKCFLFGNYKHKKLLVLPSINYFMPGTDINFESKRHLLSPLLKKVNINEFKVIAIGYGETIDFGKLSDLRYKTF